MHTSHDGTISQFKSQPNVLLNDLIEFIKQQEVDEEDDDDDLDQDDAELEEVTLMDKIK